MTKLFRCDRCNSMIEGEQVSPFNLYRVVVQEALSGANQRVWDLCRKCEDKLDEFMHSGNNTHSKLAALSTSQQGNLPHVENSSGGEPKGKPGL